MREGYHYLDVPEILEILQTEGLPLSVGRVRTRRGDRGSNQSIQEDINRWKREHGLSEISGEDQEDKALPPAQAWEYSPPVPDPELVTTYLVELREETAQVATAHYLQSLIITLRCLPGPLQTTLQRLNRAHMKTKQGIP
jgi:hypothetical protein